MAEAIVAEAVSIIVEKLGSRANRGIMMSTTNQNFHIRMLQEFKSTVEATLLDADSLESCSNAQGDVLDKISCALAELDDFLVEVAARDKQKEVMNGNKFVKAVRLFFSDSNQLFSTLRNAQRFKAIMKKFEFIAKSHAQFGGIISMPSVNETKALLSTETTRFRVITDVVIGRDGDRNNIISMLFDSSLETPTLSVSSIVGIGGVGKTTLAQYVYHDEQVKSCFDVQFWVSVTQDFDVKKVLDKILRVASDMDEISLDCEIDYQLYDHFLLAIGRKKFLLVLDNIWAQHDLRSKWLKLRNLLSVGARGSKVLITTRCTTTAGIMDSSGPYMLGDLTEHDSWLLFQQIAFTQMQEPGVKAIGYEISKMCPNVPLVIQSIGSFLAEKCTLQEWKAFKDDQLANFSSYGRDIIQTLRLSYDQLEKRLKLCIAYCSLFPKGYEYDKDVLVRLWISLGYVKPQYRSQSLEEAAEAYMLILVNHNFLKIMRAYEFDSQVLLTMHDVMHDLVRSIVGFEYKMADSNTNEFDQRACHVSFGTLSETCWEVPSSLLKIQHLRSFLLAVPSHCKLTLKNLSIFHGLILRFSRLRILDLHGLGTKDVPRSLGELRCLQYLDLSHNSIVKLSNSITQLVNLLSLNLLCCKELQELPKGITKLADLRHLTVLGCNELSHMPKGLGNLTNLRTLDMFILREHNPQRGSKAYAAGGLAELSHLNSLTGGLRIHVFGRPKDAISEAKAANLKSMDKLKSLRLEFNYGSTKDDEMIIEGLQPNPNLRNLRINGYAGEKIPSWMLDRLHFWLPNLAYITIYHFKGCRCLCSFGRLPNLRILNLCFLDNVEYIEEDTRSGSIVNSDHVMDVTPLFPSLETLMLISMPKLRGWRRIFSNGGEDTGQPVQYNLLEKKQAFPRLKHMDAPTMELLTSMTREFRGMSSLETLTIAKCEDLKAIPECITNFSSLKGLTLKNCSKKLRERCQKPTGEDCSKIEHITNINMFINLG